MPVVIFILHEVAVSFPKHVRSVSSGLTTGIIETVSAQQQQALGGQEKPRKRS